MGRKYEVIIQAQFNVEIDLTEFEGEMKAEGVILNEEEYRVHAEYAAIDEVDGLITISENDKRVTDQLPGLVSFTALDIVDSGKTE